MRKGDGKVLILIILPLEVAHAALPLLLVRSDSEYRAKSHFVEFALTSHTSNGEGQSLPRLDSLDGKVKPGVIVTSACVRKSISRHPAVEVIRIVFNIAPSQVSRIKFARYLDAISKFELTLSWVVWVKRCVFHEFFEGGIRSRQVLLNDFVILFLLTPTVLVLVIRLIVVLVI